MESTQDNIHFDELVRRDFELKVTANPAYSLRAYSKKLGISPATLSGYLSGKRQLSTETLGKIGLAIGLMPEDVWNFQKRQLGVADKDSDHQFNELSQDMFMLVSEWYHLAILEVMKLQDFKPDSRWVAKRLGVNINQINIALKRLQRIGILKVTVDGVWIDNMKGFTGHYNKEHSSTAKRNYQKQLLEKSLESIEHDDFSIRDHSSTTMAIDVNDMLIAKEEIFKFRKKFSKKMENTNDTNEVYQLQVSFFPLTKK